MRSADVREPIPNGFVKLVGFIVLVAGATFLAWRYVGEAWAAAVLIGFFTAVRLVHPQGWTNWVREFWYWNVRGIVECFHEDETGKLVRELVPYYGRKVYSWYRHGRLVSGKWQRIVIRRSGWSFLGGWVEIGGVAVDMFWFLEPGQESFTSLADQPFPCPTKTVWLKQYGGACLELPVGQALQMIVALTDFSQSSSWPNSFLIDGVRPFNSMLKIEITAASAVTTNGA